MGRPPPRLLAPAGSKSTVYLDRLPTQCLGRLIDRLISIVKQINRFTKLIVTRNLTIRFISIRQPFGRMDPLISAPWHWISSTVQQDRTFLGHAAEFLYMFLYKKSAIGPSLAHLEFKRCRTGCCVLSLLSLPLPFVKNPHEDHLEQKGKSTYSS